VLDVGLALFVTHRGHADGTPVAISSQVHEMATHVESDFPVRKVAQRWHASGNLKTSL
jgi:hypothetical protein